MNPIKVEISGSYDALTKSAVITLRQPCSSPEMAINGTRLFAQMFNEALKQAREEKRNAEIKGRAE